MDKNLPKILGNLCGDGNISTTNNRICYVNESKKSVEEFRQNMKKCFGISFGKTNIPKGKNIYWTQIKNKPIHGLLKQYFSEKTLHHECRVPNIIRTGTNKQKREFVKYLYGDDGSVFVNSRGQPTIALNSTSKQMIYDVHNILKGKGINKKPTEQFHHHKNRGRRNQWEIRLMGKKHIDGFQKNFGFSKNSTTKGLQKQRVLDLCSYYYKPFQQ